MTNESDVQTTHGKQSNLGQTGMIPPVSSEGYEFKFTDAARAYMEEHRPKYVSDFHVADPEFVELFMNFAFDDVVNTCPLSSETRAVTLLAAVIGTQSIHAYRSILPMALRNGLRPELVKEVVYQAVAYLGLARVYPFLTTTNGYLSDMGVDLPLPPQSTTTRETRREAGTQAQVDIFGEDMCDFWKSGNPDYPHINEWLAANCFGDYYTRGVLDLAQRELITLCLLAAQSGCEQQLVSHAVGNMRIGNSKELLVNVVSGLVPFIGYPRCLNALACIDTAEEQMLAAQPKGAPQKSVGADAEAGAEGVAGDGASSSAAGGEVSDPVRGAGLDAAVADDAAAGAHVADAKPGFHLPHLFRRS